MKLTTVQHHNPQDFGISQVEADKMRIAYLRPRLASLKPRADRLRALLVSLPGHQALERGIVYDALQPVERLIEKHTRHIAALQQAIKSPNPDKRRIDISIIKGIPMQTVLDFCGLREQRPGWYVCPQHEEKTASFHITPGTNHCHCFSCGENFSTIDVVMAVDKSTVAQAIRRLEALV